MRSCGVPFSLLLFLVLAPPALAIDGVLEINQACAVHTGCFSGDTAGYPVTIDGSAGHSYRLTGDLELSVPVAAIEVLASNSVIDLNGFRIYCGLGCLPSGDGIMSDASVSGVTVKNGSIHGTTHAVRLRGFGSTLKNVRAHTTEGIYLGSGCTIEDSLQIGLGGTTVGDYCNVLRLYSNSNSSYGLWGGKHVSVRDSSFGNDNAIGAVLGDEARIENCDFYGNDELGVVLGWNSTVSGSRIWGSPDGGISMKSGAVVNSIIIENGEYGIMVSPGAATITSNVIQLNSGLGIVGGGKSGYSQNVIRDNNGGNANPQVSGATEMGPNLCGGDPTCP